MYSNFDPLQSAYWKECSKHPLLNKNEEYIIATAAKNGDKKAREKMILSNLNLAKKIANDFHKKSNCNLSDLIQESNVGLIKAVDLFDPEKGVKFSAYASWWMKHEVRFHIMKMSSFASQGPNSRMFLWKIKTAQEKYRKDFDSEPSYEELAKLVGINIVQLKGFLAIAERAKNLDAPIQDSEGKSEPLHSIIADSENESPDTIIDNKKIANAINKALYNLTEREKLVLTLRFGLLDRFKDDPRFAETALILSNDFEEND